MGWFTERQFSEIYLWSPTPVVMETAIEMIVEASQKGL